MLKKSRNLIIVGIIVGLLGSIGIFGGIYYNAVTGLEIEVENIYITDSSLGGTLLDPNIDVDLEIHALVSNPTILPVSIKNVQFDLYLEDEYIGDGETGTFRATKSPSDLVIVVELEDLDGIVYLEMLDLILLGHSKTITVTITYVEVFFMILEPNQDIDVIVEQEDILP